MRSSTIILNLAHVHIKMVLLPLLSDIFLEINVRVCLDVIQKTNERCMKMIFADTPDIFLFVIRLK